MTDDFQTDHRLDDLIEGAPAGNPSGFCLCGCGERTPLASVTRKRHGYRKGEPTLYVYGHFKPRKPEPLESKYVVDPATGCWNWTAYCKPGGYGQCRDHGRTSPAHRAVYRRYVGEIPAGLDLDHLCHNKRCVNPAHLEAVTRAENVRRKATTKLTAEQVAEIRASSDRNVDLAERFGVAATTICDIRKGRRWRGVAQTEVSNAA